MKRLRYPLEAFAEKEPDRSAACETAAADILKRVVAAGFTNIAAIRYERDGRWIDTTFSRK